MQGASGLARRFKASLKSDIFDPGRHNKAGWLSAESLTNALIRQNTSLPCFHTKKASVDLPHPVVKMAYLDTGRDQRYLREMGFRLKQANS